MFVKCKMLWIECVQLMFLRKRVMLNQDRSEQIPICTTCKDTSTTYNLVMAHLLEKKLYTEPTGDVNLGQAEAHLLQMSVARAAVLALARRHHRILRTRKFPQPANDQVPCRRTSTNKATYAKNYLGGFNVTQCTNQFGIPLKIGKIVAFAVVVNSVGHHSKGVPVCFFVQGFVVANIRCLQKMSSVYCPP